MATMKLLAEILGLVRDVLTLYRDILEAKKRTIKEVADDDIQSFRDAAIGGDHDNLNVLLDKLYADAQHATGGVGRRQGDRGAR